MAPPLKRILLVDDDPDIQLVTGMALESVGGLTVRACGSGREALAAAPGFAPDLFLLDVMMPEMDGTAVLQALREVPALARIPAVFLTAKVQPGEIDQYRKLGVADVVAKPFDPMTLADTIRRIWERIHAGTA
jgi:CheY-like chemotaxis protein